MLSPQHLYLIAQQHARDLEAEAADERLWRRLRRPDRQRRPGRLILALRVLIDPGLVPDRALGGTGTSRS